MPRISLRGQLRIIIPFLNLVRCHDKAVLRLVVFNYVDGNATQELSQFRSGPLQTQ